MDVGSLVVGANNLAAAAHADILATVIIGLLLEVFFTFGPRLPLEVASAAEEKEPICFSPFLHLRLLALASAGGAEDLAIDISIFLPLRPVFTSSDDGAESEI